MTRGYWNGKMIMVYAYKVATPEATLQDERALERLHALMLDRALAGAEALGLFRPYEDAYYGVDGKPVPFYDEDGEYVGDRILLYVEIPVVALDNPVEDE